MEAVITMSNVFELVKEYKEKGKIIKEQIKQMVSTEDNKDVVASFDNVESVAVVFSLATREVDGVEEATLAEIRTNTGVYPFAYVAQYDDGFLADKVSLPKFDSQSKKALEAFFEEPNWIDEADLDENLDPILEILHRNLEGNL